LASWSESSEQY